MANIIYRNQANKIYIYNSADEVVNDPDDKLIEPKNTSSITILTSGIPEYHIRIKNNFADDKKIKKIEQEEDFEVRTNAAEPLNSFKDSKSKGEAYTINEDVLLRSDDVFYLGTVVKIQNGKYLVKFDDNTEKWSCERGLKKLNSSVCANDTDDEPLCVICKERNETDLVEVCNKCCRGYHRYCIKKDSSNFSSPWCCDRCTASEIISISDSEDNDSDVVINKLLSYDVKSLKWDLHHRENEENIYCYCGKTGSWKLKMLQCCKCQQWFHEKCISSWRGYLAHGDTMFIFCCKICNASNGEFLQRLNFSWKTAAHLILYELTIVRPQKSYSISKEVAPLLWNLWEQLHLPFAKYHSKDKLVKKLLQTFKQEVEFKCFGVGKQKNDLVCLRRKVPPNCPKVIVPVETIVSEKSLKKLNIKTLPLNEILKQEDTENQEEKLVQKTPGVLFKTKRGRKSSKKYCQEPQPDKSSQSFNDDSSDENSSKSTLDRIIPPPSNFHGRNNPFHSQYKPSAKFKASERKSKKGQLTVFEKLPEIRIVRTIKRRLSAKDIALASNRDMKRRKVMKRRKSSDVEIISEVLQPITMPLPSYPPVHNGDQKESGKPYRSQQNRRDSCESMSVQERRYSREIVDRVRNSVVKVKLEEKTSSGINITEAVINSPVKNEAINLYFGAFNRIENGEKFTILAKRITPDGKEQFLLDWDTPNYGASSSSVKKDLNL